jgi:hypothetical protein
MSHRWGESTFWSRKTSARSSRSKMPRRFTQPPRLVDTVTSGDVVTIRAASSGTAPAISLRIFPKPPCVESGPRDGTSTRAGTGTGAASRCRAVARANGTAARKARTRVSSASPATASASHSRPSGTPMVARNSAICSGLMRPAWLSLWPAKGRP